MAAQPLDTLAAERWARLRDDVRRCELRRGAWYPVLSVASDEAVLVVRRRGVIIPLAYLEITQTRPRALRSLPQLRRPRRGRTTARADALRQVSGGF